MTTSSPSTNHVFNAFTLKLLVGVWYFRLDWPTIVISWQEKKVVTVQPLHAAPPTSTEWLITI